MSESLKNKTLRGVGWSFADNITSGGVSFLTGLVLARLLSPAEFGIIGMITLFIAISNSIIDSGFSNALIRKTNAKDIDYSTVFYFNLIAGIVLYCILYLCSPAIGRFFNEPLLIPVTRVMGSVLVINALSIIQRTLLVKKVDFKTQTKISLIASVASGLIGVGMAFSGWGVWSLVGQQVFRQLFNSFFLWIDSKWKPAWAFSRKSFNELFGFGSKLLFSGLLDTAYRNIYYVIIGRFYSAAQLGQYTRAEQFNSVFSSNLTAVIQRVSYPVLSSIQDEPERLKLAYQRIIKITMLISFTCMLSLAAVAKPLILILIGEKWLEAALFLPIICFSGMLYPLHAINLNILQVKGRSDLFLKLEIIKKVIAIAPVLLGIVYGINCMLWGSVCTSVIAYFLNSHYSADLINYPVKEQLKDVFPSLGISGIIAFIVWSITLWEMNIYVTFTLQCLLGVLLVIFIHEKTKLTEYAEIRYMIFSVIKRIQTNGK